jgi:CheY-like chemotaxis protein
MGHTILLADDSITIQKVIELTFSDEDFKLHTVGNGQRAIDDVRSVKPDVVLCDIIMPEKNGYEVCEFIKSSPDLRHIPVLLLTGAFEPFDQERARRAGCDGFLAKPFEPQTLISRVRELLAAAVKEPPALAAPPLPAATEVPARPTSEPGPDATVLGAPALGNAEPSENLAYEVGDRELSLGPRDRDLLVEPDEADLAAESAASEDIWSEVQGEFSMSAEPASVGDEGSATLMMDSSSFGISDGGAGFGSMAVSESEPTFGEPGDEAMPTADDEPATAAEPQAAPAEPELTPMGEYPSFGGFGTTEDEEPAEVGESTLLFQSPGAVEEPSWTSSSASSVWEQEPSPVESDWPEAEPTPATKSPWGEPPAATGSLGAAADTESQVHEEVAGFDDVESFEEESIAGPSAWEASQEAGPEERPIAPPEPVQTASPSVPVTPSPGAGSSSSPPGPGMSDAQWDQLVEKVTERVVSRLSERVIQEVAWEVVPELAEALIKKEIETLKAKIPS